MRRFRIGLALTSAVAIGACSGEADKVFLAQPGQVAYVRFVNAITDSGGQDWRFVDAVEGSPTAFNLVFRADLSRYELPERNRRRPTFEDLSVGAGSNVCRSDLNVARRSCRRCSSTARSR